MAALVSHAMRRFPTSPPDTSYSSYRLRGESSRHSSESGESALSRSMRYADPWLYSGAAPVAAAGLLLAPALVLCACPDYLNGTKRSNSKKSPATCKKCKGTRLPLSTLESSCKFGTVRCYPTTTLHPSTTPLRAGTVRVTSSTRPSILPASQDPYDLMRRSRLSGPTDSRARSVSPKPKGDKEKGASTAKSKSNKSDAYYNSTFGRRSILECDINPYELVSTDNATAKSKDNSITLVNGQRIRIRPSLNDQEYEDVQVLPQRATPSRSAPPTPKLEKTKEVTPITPPKTLVLKSPLISPIPTSPDLTSRFKSILKKPTSFGDSDNSPSSLERTPSPLRKSGSQKKGSKGSQFYLPTPCTTPRKKVQFLMSEEKEGNSDMEDCREEEIEKGIYERISIPEEKEKVEKVVNVKEAGGNRINELKKKEIDKNTNKGEKKIVTLKRSLSDSIMLVQKKALFTDTMTQRKRKPKINSKMSLNDLEKLDGTISRTRKSSLNNIKSEDLSSLSLLNDIKEQTVKEVNKEKFKENNLLPSEKSLEFEQKPVQPTSVENRIKNHISSSCLPDEKIFLDKLDKCIAGDVPSDDKPNSEVPPSVPPRKRSNNKQPQITILKPMDIPTETPTPLPPLIVTPPIQLASLFIENKTSDTQIIDNDVSTVLLPPTLIDDKIPIIQTVKVDSLDNDKITVQLPSNMTQNKSSAYQTIKVDPIHNDNFNFYPPFSPVQNNVTGIQTVKVESPTLNFESKKVVVQVNGTPTIHKIQIRNEYEDNFNVKALPVFDNPQRKTSIMINGDDCYSTVNVNDNIPLYQSSVVVKDPVDDVSSFIKTNKKSSTIYITGTFEPNNTSNGDIEQPTDNKTVPTNGDIEESCDDKLVTKDDTLDKKCNGSFEENIIENINKEFENLSIDQSARLLTELLRDPVEAVRRNLVPHVCGKSDTSRRPPDRKLWYSSMPISKVVRSETPSLEEKNITQGSVEESFSKLRNYESICDDGSSEHSSSTQYELMDAGSDCYTDHSNRSSLTEEEMANRTKFYELLAEAALIEVAENDEHQYESIKHSNDPIYEEIEIPPPLPSNPPPANILDDLNLDKEYTTRSIFEGASKYDILSYLVDAKERGIVPEDSYTYSNISQNGSTTEEDTKETYNRVSQLSSVSDSSEENSLIISGALIEDKTTFQKTAEVERNDSGVGSETSKSSLSKYRTKQEISILCEDCEMTVEGKIENEPLLCRKCIKKRSERKEIISEIVETEEKYSRDLQIILEEFYQPMLVAGLLTADQLSAIFLNVEELLENSQGLAERLRDAVEIALEQGDDDLLTVNIGKLFLEATPMLHAFETYCVRQGAASLLLASLEKEKELLRIFLRVSQMENTMLRRMNLNSFLMVPVQRVTKYPLLLARLYKVTPTHYDNRDELKDAQHKIELHLNHMNSETKDVPSKLWRRIGSNSGRRSSAEMDLANIKLRKIAVDVLEWNHEEAKFVLEGKLLYTQPSDNNWRKGRTIKLTPVNALLVINGKPSSPKPGDRSEEHNAVFTKPSSKEAALLLVRDKNGRYSLLRDPLFLDRCIIAADPAWQCYFEVQELLGKDTFIFKAEDEEQTHNWYKQLQLHAQGLGTWRKRRNALANIMINGMGLR